MKPGMTRKDRPGVIAPPPLIHLGFIGAGILLDLYWPLPLLPEAAQFGAGAALIAGASALAALAFREFHRARTPTDLRKATLRIITTGPFRHTRNPLYLGLGIAHAGIAFALDSVWVLALLIPAVALIHCGVVLREERYLAAKFGDLYLGYKASAPRWF